MRRTNFYIKEEQFDYLQDIDSLSVSEHIRRSIDEYIERLKNINVSSSSSKNGK